MLRYASGLVAILVLAAAGARVSATTVAAQPGSATESSYRETHGELLWLNEGKPNALSREALEILVESSSHGLHADEYWLDELTILNESLVRGTSDFAAEYEGLLTDALLRLFRDLRPQLAQQSPGEAGAGTDLALRLIDAVRSGDLRRFYESLIPRHRQYSALRAALRQTESGIGIATVSLGRGPTLRRGDSGERVAVLRARLLDEYWSDSNAVFDAALEAAVRKYQLLNGLTPDGFVGRHTQEHMDMSAADRAARIRLALARWRELPVELGRDYVHVNIPEYRLEMFRDGSPSLDMRVVVGSKEDPTPDMIDELEYLVFNPYWHVPRRIALEELVPQAAVSPGYLGRNDYEVLSEGAVIDEQSIDWAGMDQKSFAYRIRQRPGKSNALGTVKFLFPNSLDIYLHDSPARSLYERTARAFSHGCIRVEDPQALARALLESQGTWDDARIAETIGKGARRQINLREPVPVYLTYITVKVTETGEIAFFDDVYGRDSPVLRRYL